MIKIFGKGLGRSDATETVSLPVQFTGQAQQGTIERDFNDYKKARAGEKLTVSEGDQLKTFVQTPADKSSGTKQQLVPLVLNLDLRPQVFSATSGFVPFETFFHEFDLQVFPFYNFWTADELTNESDERGERKLEDVPRFVKLSWLIAPDLQDPEEQVPKRVNKRTIKPIIFARELERPNVFREKGIDFTPEHLQPRGFSSIKGVIANGHLAPGVLETVVEMPLVNSTVIPPLSVNMMDEDCFLNDPSTRGVAAHELRAQELQLSNGTLAAASLGRDGLSSACQLQKDSIVDGKFNVVKAPNPGGVMLIQGVHPSSPTIGISVVTATAAKGQKKDMTKEFLAKYIQPEPFSSVPQTAQTKVKFFNPSVGALVGQDKVRLMTAPEHLETMAAIAPSLSSLELLSRSNYYNLARKIEIPSLPSPKSKQHEYIGYVIEKYKRGKSGVFIRVDEIDIPNREINEYIDTKVLYGEIYRYRIRAVFRWTRPQTLGPMGRDKTVFAKFGSSATALASFFSSYFYGEWSQKWVYGSCVDDQPPPPPDEICVRPESHRKRVVVTFRLPENKQKDILSMRLFRKIQDQDGNDLTDWLPMTNSDGTVDCPPQNVIFFDTDVEFIQISKRRYLYTAQTVSRHGEDSVLSEQLAARLNQDYFSRGEYLVEFVSSAGVRMEYFGAFSVIPFRVSKTELVVAPPPTAVGSTPGVAAVILVGRDATGNMQGISTDYVMRVQSLDTGESIDIPFDVEFNYLPPREIFQVSTIFTPVQQPEKKITAAPISFTPVVLQAVLASYQDFKAFELAHDKTETLVVDRAWPGERWNR